MSNWEHLIDIARDITEIQKKIEEDLREIARILQGRDYYVETLEIPRKEEKKDDSNETEK